MTKPPKNLYLISDPYYEEQLDKAKRLYYQIFKNPDQLEKVFTATQKKKADKVIQLLKQGLEMYADPEPWFMLGMLYSCYPDLEQSLKCYRRSIKLNPKYFYAISEASIVALKLDKRAGSIRLTKAALRLNNSEPGLYWNYVLCLIINNDMKTALVQAKRAVKKWPKKAKWMLEYIETINSNELKRPTNYREALQQME